MLVSSCPNYNTTWGHSDTYIVPQGKPVPIDQFNGLMATYLPQLEIGQDKAKSGDSSKSNANSLQEWGS